MIARELNSAELSLSSSGPKKVKQLTRGSSSLHSAFVLSRPRFGIFHEIGRHLDGWSASAAANSWVRGSLKPRPRWIKLLCVCCTI
jgi:hypothetical protein